MVFTRAASRRTACIREVFSSCPVAFWKRRLKASFFRLARLLAQLVGSLLPQIGRFHGHCPFNITSGPLTRVTLIPVEVTGERAV